MHDPYAGVAPTWDADAARVYGPIAADLVAAAPHPLAGHVVLDAGAGTGLAGRELRAGRARGWSPRRLGGHAGVAPRRAAARRGR